MTKTRKLFDSSIHLAPAKAISAKTDSYTDGAIAIATMIASCTT